MIKILFCNDSKSTFHVTTMRLQFSKFNTKLEYKIQMLVKYMIKILFCNDFKSIVHY